MKKIKINNKEFIIIGLFLTLGFIIRLDFVLQLTGNSLLTGDTVSYNSIADNLVQGNGFTNSEGEVPVLPPLYPAFLALFYFLFGHNFFIIQLVQIILNLIAIYLFYLILKTYLNKFSLYVFLFLSILYPFYIFWTRYLLTDINFVLLNTLIIYIILNKTKEFKSKFFIIGFLLSLTILQRGSGLFLPFLLFIYYFISHNFKIAIKFFLIGIIIISFFLISWGLYNYSKHKKFILTASYGGMALYLANNPKTRPDQLYYSTNKCFEEDFFKAIANKSFFEKDDLCKKRALEYIKEYPLFFLKNWFIRIKVFWKEQRYGNMLQWPLFKILNPFIRIIDSLVLYLGIIGLIYCLKEFKKYLLFYIIFIYYTCIYSLFSIVELARFRLPVMLIVIFFAVKGMELISLSVLKIIKKL